MTGGPSLFVPRSFGCYLQHRTFPYADVVISRPCEIREVLAGTSGTVIFLGPEFKVPPRAGRRRDDGRVSSAG
jgi:hypothetical protein